VLKVNERKRENDCEEKKIQGGEEIEREERKSRGLRKMRKRERERERRRKRENDEKSGKMIRTTKRRGQQVMT
jgi:hypothetical protein